MEKQNKKDNFSKRVLTALPTEPYKNQIKKAVWLFSSGTLLRGSNHWEQAHHTEGVVPKKEKGARRSPS